MPRLSTISMAYCLAQNLQLNIISNGLAFCGNNRRRLGTTVSFSSGEKDPLKKGLPFSKLYTEQTEESPKSSCDHLDWWLCMRGDLSSHMRPLYCLFLWIDRVRPQPLHAYFHGLGPSLMLHQCQWLYFDDFHQVIIIFLSIIYGRLELFMIFLPGEKEKKAQ